jgi:hypothetical protein
MIVGVYDRLMMFYQDNMAGEDVYLLPGRYFYVGEYICLLLPWYPAQIRSVAASAAQSPKRSTCYTNPQLLSVCYVLVTLHRYDHGCRSTPHRQCSRQNAQHAT